MKSVYYILEQIRDHLRSNGVSNTVSFGEVEQIEDDKTTIFPLAHIDLDSCFIRPRVIEIRLTILAMDIVDQPYSEESEDEFYRGNNIQDVYNTQLWTLMDLTEAMRRGELWDNKIRLIEDPEVSSFAQRFDNILAGWGGTFVIQLPNEVSIC